MTEQGSNSESVFACIFTALHGMFFRTKPNEFPLASHFGGFAGFCSENFTDRRNDREKIQQGAMFSVHALLARACGMI